MKNKIEYVIEINGEKIFFWAEDLNHAQEIVLGSLNALQDVCEHKNFKNGKCENCGFKCEHDQEVEENHCLDCGEFVDTSDQSDVAYEAWRECEL